MRTRVSEEKLLLFQSKKSLFNFGLFKKFILSPFNTLGTIQGLTNNYGTVLSCTASTAKRVGYCAIPSEPSFRCNVVGKCSIYIGLASAYVALIANALPILHANSAQSVATQNILSGMNFLTDLLTTHDFFLLVFSSVFSNAISVEIDTAQFFLWIVIPSLVLACLVNNDARFKIYEKLGCYQPPFGYRKNIARISDLVCGFIKGGMFGIPLVNTIQSIADYIQHAPSNSANSWRCSLEGLITRYSIGIGLFASTEAMLYWKYNPFSEGGVDFNRMEFISNVEGIVGTILILSYFIPALLNNQKIDIIVLTGIMIFMGILSSVFYGLGLKRERNVPNEQPSSDNRRPFPELFNDADDAQQAQSPYSSMFSALIQNQKPIKDIKDVEAEADISKICNEDSDKDNASSDINDASSLKSSALQNFGTFHIGSAIGSNKAVQSTTEYKAFH